MLCLAANSCTYRLRCFGLILWNVPLCARLSIDQKDSTPLVWALSRCTYSDDASDLHRV